MEQVEAVPLRYERKRKKRPRRTSNRERFEMLLVGLVAPGWVFTLLPRVSGAWQILIYIIFAILTLFSAVQFSNFLQRYRLAARRWMARPGERRILSHQTRLRAFRIRLSRRLDRIQTTIQSAGDVEPRGTSPNYDIPKPALAAHPTSGQSSMIQAKHRREHNEMSSSARQLRVGFIAAGLSAYCILFFKFLLPDPSQNPASFAFGIVWGLVMLLGIVCLVTELVVGTLRDLRARKASTSKGLLQRWAENWQPRIESFEMPQNDPKA